MNASDLTCLTVHKAGCKGRATHPASHPILVKVIINPEGAISHLSAVTDTRSDQPRVVELSGSRSIDRRPRVNLRSDADEPANAIPMTDQPVQ
jgi:hypothetical protein